MYSLAILMKYFLKEIKGSEFWVVQKQHLNDKNSIFVQLHFIICYILIYGYHINYLKYTNNITAYIFHYLLFYIYKQDQHNYFWYY